jgi:hypothetical protein
MPSDFGSAAYWSRTGGKERAEVTSIDGTNAG